MSRSNDNSVFTDLRVIELGTSMVTGPFCGQMLADLGANVIKIEGKSGDMIRTTHPIKGDMSANFMQFNRNKRSVVIDLKADEGKEIAMSLIKGADVLIENFRPGVADRLGFGYEEVKKTNPRLVYTSINGFGSDGPYSHLPAYDQVVQGIAGYMPVQGSHENPEPVKTAIVDKVTSLSAFAAILAALYDRTASGTGQRIEVPMLDAFAAIMLPEIMGTVTFVDGPTAPLITGSIYRTLKTADGHLVGLIAQDSQFKAICRALGCDELVEEERFATAAQRFQLMDEIYDELEKRSSKKKTAELLEKLWADGEVAIAPVNSFEQFLNDPQVQHNGTVQKVRDQKYGEFLQLGRFAKFEKWPTPGYSAAPGLGQHTTEVMQEAGYEKEKIAEWAASDIIRQS